MSIFKTSILSYLGAVLIALITSKTASASQFFGDSQPLGKGAVRSYITLDQQGNPLELGLTLTAGALSIPTDDSAVDIPIFLSLPSEASTTVFNHIELTYRPKGYPWLPSIFAVPRFTVDNFLISPEQQSLICANADINYPLSTCPPEQIAKALKQPNSELIPQDFLPTGIVEPGKGARYFDTDLLPPIIQGQKPFNTLYDYAFFDGKISLIGFGSTKEFLETQPNIHSAIKIPNSYSKSGYYPSQYSIKFDANSQEYKLAMTDFKYRSVPDYSSIFGLLSMGFFIVFTQSTKKLKNNN